MAEYLPVSETDPDDDVHSSDVKNFMARMPHGIIRWGMMAIFGIALLLVWLSSFVRYPDIATLRCILTSVRAPQEIKARVDGRLVKLFVQENDSVSEGQVLAWLETSAKHEQVKQLQAALVILSQAIQSGQTTALVAFGQTQFSQLGELQQAYQSLMREYTLFVPYVANGYYHRKKAYLQQELTQIQQLQSVLRGQYQTLERDLSLAQAQLDAQQQLYVQKVIPQLDYQQQQSTYLAKQLPLQQAQGRLIEGEGQRTAKHQQLLEMENAYVQQKATLQQSVGYVQSLVAAWQLKYELVAPIGGKIHLPGLLQEKSNVGVNSTVFTIGGDSANYFGFAPLPQTYVGKVKPGQRVLVKFDGYPYYEFGFVEGRIGVVDRAAASDSNFHARIVFPQGLATQNHSQLPFRQGLTATAEVVLEDRSVLQKFTYDINKVLSASR